MSDLTTIREAGLRVERAEKELAEARAAVKHAVAEGHAHGLSLSAIARELGITRQRVAQIVRGK